LKNKPDNLFFKQLSFFQRMYRLFARKIYKFKLIFGVKKQENGQKMCGQEQAKADGHRQNVVKCVSF